MFFFHGHLQILNFPERRAKTSELIFWTGFWVMLHPFLYSVLWLFPWDSDVHHVHQTLSAKPFSFFSRPYSRAKRATCTVLVGYHLCLPWKYHVKPKRKALIFSPFIHTLRVCIIGLMATLCCCLFCCFSKSQLGNQYVTFTTLRLFDSGQKGDRPDSDFVEPCRVQTKKHISHHSRIARLMG